MRTDYTVGFLHSDTHVVLVQKNRPDWQAGKLNGVGGHVEPGETAHECQVREFQEETGVLVPKWEHFLNLSGTKSFISVFAAYDTGNWMKNVKTVTDERIRTVYIGHILEGEYLTVPNMKWIVPLLLQRGNYKPITVEFYGD